MKFKTFIFVMLLLTTTLCFGQKQIRNANWGWNKDSVKKSETLKLLSETKDHLIYSGTLANCKFAISYKFIKNKLTGVVYIYSETHVNQNNYISTYENLKDILTKKYDTTVTDEIIWKNDLYKDNKDDWGLACSEGDVVFKSTWTNKYMDITLVCAGENFNISLGIVYTSKEFSTLITKENEDQNDKDF